MVWVVDANTKHFAYCYKKKTFIKPCALYVLLKAAFYSSGLQGFILNKLALRALRGGAAIGGGAMPFIDDALLWCPDNDGRMVDISACLPVSMNIKVVIEMFLGKVYTVYTIKLSSKMLNTVTLLPDKYTKNTYTNNNDKLFRCFVFYNFIISLIFFLIFVLCYSETQNAF